MLQRGEAGHGLTARWWSHLHALILQWVSTEPGHLSPASFRGQQHPVAFTCCGVRADRGTGAPQEVSVPSSSVQGDCLSSPLVARFIVGPGCWQVQVSKGWEKVVMLGGKTA